MRRKDMNKFKDRPDFGKAAVEDMERAESREAGLESERVQFVERPGDDAERVRGLRALTVAYYADDTHYELPKPVDVPGNKGLYADDRGKIYLANLDNPRDGPMDEVGNLN